MSKKIVIVGPSGAGKTTLRKVFFEGESSTKLLEYALEPTYGEESLILRLSEDVGIFDLAGQENDRWFTTEDKAVFYNTKIIIVVLDASAETDSFLEFIARVVEIRNLLTPSSYIYILIHKIDLISDKQLKEVKYRFNHDISSKTLMRAFFTSIKKEYFISTLSVFTEIMIACLKDEDTVEKFDYIFIEEAIRLSYLINKEVVVSKKNLKDKLNRTEFFIDNLVTHLKAKKFLETRLVDGEEIIKLTDLGRKYYNEVLKKFSLENIFPLIEPEMLSDVPSSLEIPPFIGALIADKDGRSLLTIELFEGALLTYLINPNRSTANSKADIELIPMLVSALEKFSMEINIKDLSGFNLRGTNLNMQIFGYDNFTVTFFMNPNINIEVVESTIYNYFFNLFEDNKKLFKSALQTGSIDNILPFQESGRKWLKELNEAYKEMVINLKVIDIDKAKLLYSKLDELYKDISRNFSITLEKIKTLKINLVKSLAQKDFEELRNIGNRIQEIMVKYTT